MGTLLLPGESILLYHTTENPQAQALKQHDDGKHMARLPLLAVLIPLAAIKSHFFLQKKTPYMV